MPRIEQTVVVPVSADDANQQLLHIDGFARGCTDPDLIAKAHAQLGDTQPDDRGV